MNTLPVAILGSGNIGTDLLIKVLRSKFLSCTSFIGRRAESPGLELARLRGVPVAVNGIDAIINNPAMCKLVFDATSAEDHKHHAPILERLGIKVVDLTPAKLGEMTIPAIDNRALQRVHNVNMISCGGQTSIPIAYAVSRAQSGIEYIEVVSSIASKSAGPATRANIDEYVETTELGLVTFSGCSRAKTLLVLNPAEPPISMQTTISCKVENPQLDTVRASVQAMVQKIKSYVPGYELIVPPVYEHNRIITMVRVQGRGDFLPTYAGNLDIINCAAIAVAEEYARFILGAQGDIV